MSKNRIEKFDMLILFNPFTTPLPLIHFLFTAQFIWYCQISQGQNSKTNHNFPKPLQSASKCLQANCQMAFCNSCCLLCLQVQGFYQKRWLARFLRKNNMFFLKSKQPLFWQNLSTWQCFCFCFAFKFLISMVDWFSPKFGASLQLLFDFW